MELIVPLCAYGMEMQKLILWLATPRMAATLAHVGAKECLHARHSRLAAGLLPDGTPAAASTSRYPALVCGAVAPVPASSSHLTRPATNPG